MDGRQAAASIPPFEFENWAVIALGGIPNKAQVGDMGIDGRIYPVSAVEPGARRQKRVAKAGAGELGFMDVWYPIQVKQKDKVGRPDIDTFEACMMREDRAKGFFVSFDYSSRCADGDRSLLPQDRQGHRAVDRAGDPRRADRAEARLALVLLWVAARRWISRAGGFLRGWRRARTRGCGRWHRAHIKERCLCLRRWRGRGRW